MDDFSERLGKVEVGVAEIRARLPYLATSAELNGLRADMHAMETRLVGAMGSVHTELVDAIGSTRADLVGAIGSTRAELVSAIGSARAELVSAIGSTRAELIGAIGSARTELIKWLVGTLLSSVAAAAAVARFLS